MQKKQATKKTEQIAIESIRHKDHRVNIPTEELRDFVAEDEATPKTMLYPRDPSLDPQLVWKGKDEQDAADLAVPVVPIYIQEKIHPQAIIDSLPRIEKPADNQIDLFSDFNGLPADFDQRVDFYRHDGHWSNRMILGDSLMVMTSLAEKEGLKGSVQTIYFDPPYGIKFGSNWQVSTRKRDVKDGKAEDATRQPEQVRAFRDTWKLGIHSYLAYLRDRLVAARELLTETGSVFVQIGDENVHLVRSVMDEVFGAENCCQIIPFRKKLMPLGATLLEGMFDYLLWYAKDIPRVKFRHLFRRSEPKATSRWTNIELPDGTRRSLTKEENLNSDLIPIGSKVYRLVSQRAPSFSPASVYDFKFKGHIFSPPKGGCWLSTKDKMEKLASAHRLESEADNLSYVYFHDDFPLAKLTNVWDDTSPTQDKQYVVQTSNGVIQRCLLMTTDPGDLVLDPTCVREGTRIWCRQDAPSPAWAKQERLSLVPSPSTGRDEKIGCRLETVEKSAGQASFSVDGEGTRVGCLLPIQEIQPGHQVYGHDGNLHMVLRTIRRAHHGLMIGIKHEKSDAILWVTAEHRILVKRRPRSLGGQRDWSGIICPNFERAREMRKAPSPPERILWEMLRRSSLGVKFRRQHPIGSYIPDFYCHDLNLVVEVDGKEFHGSDAAKRRDAMRDELIERKLLRVVRFPASRIFSEPESVYAEIKGICEDFFKPVNTEWVEAGSLKVRDVVFFGPSLEGVRIAKIEQQETEENVFDLEVEGAHSFITEICAVHNCGSGTTAYVAEQWGRRWITCDTSRVAMALARTRLMAARYPFYYLNDSPAGIKKESEITGKVPPSYPTDNDIRKGFVYKRVPHVTLKSIANNPDIKEGMTRKQIDEAIARHADTEILYDQPYEDTKTVRVSGPFTVESLSPHRVLSTADEDMDGSVSEKEAKKHQDFSTMILENLRKAGVQNTKKGERLKFDSLDSYAGTWIHATGEYTDAGGKTRRVAVSIGPEQGTVGPMQVKEAAKEAVQGVGYDLLLMCGFAFDPHVSEEAKRYGKLTVLSARMNPDLAMGDELLKKTGAGNLFMVFGEPDVEIKKQKGGQITATIKGVDVYDPTTGEIRSSSTDDIACWFIDTNYNGESFFVRHAYFTGADEPYDKLKRALRAEIDETAWSSLYSTESRAFDKPETGKIAVKVINHYGDEVLKVFSV